MKPSLFQRRPSITGINVTPIIDVALVLVIILLITTPVMTVSDLLVDLPEAHTRGAEGGDRLSITLDPEGRISVDREIIDPSLLQGSIRAWLERPGGAEAMVVVRADGDVPHEAVDEILREARLAGAGRLAIATTRARGEAPWTR